MSGGIAQLISVGEQDKFISGNPEVSFFISNYKRHTNFAQSTDHVVISGTPANGIISTISLEHKGDLVNNMFFTAENGNSALNVDWSTLIDKVELLIGGQVIDTQDFTFSNDLAVELMAQNLSKSAAGSHYAGGVSANWFYPLRFFCCENTRTALPLVALQYHDVDVRVTWSTNVSDYIIKFYVNYIFLDYTERNKFAQVPQNILIQQVQKSPASNEKIQHFYFNHPVKCIAAKGGGACTSNTCQVVLQINGTDISEKKYAKPHYTTIASYYTVPFASGNESNFFVYPFCFDTSSPQPSGTLNFSRLDSARLVSDNTETFTTDFYAINFNILKIESGMGGLLYSD